MKNIPPQVIFAAWILAILFGIGPFIYALANWHCYWLPRAAVCL